MERSGGVEDSRMDTLGGLEEVDSLKGGNILVQTFKPYRNLQYRRRSLKSSLDVLIEAIL